MASQLKADICVQNVFQPATCSLITREPVRDHPPRHLTFQQFSLKCRNKTRASKHFSEMGWHGAVRTAEHQHFNVPQRKYEKCVFCVPQMLQEVVAKTLKHHGISVEHECFEACSKRLFDISKFYLKVSPVLSSLLLRFCPTRLPSSDHMLYFCYELAPY